MTRLEVLLASRLQITLAEYAEINGWTISAARNRAHRGTLGVPIYQPGGPRTTRFVLVTDILAANGEPQ